ncbi:hypothetical protein F5Y17DRAFT_462604 [Xylariaceae sp. FL0594]|nr:hypothetical protein F5Y17DRAFT_462604 [Xylariaceae sp. FL0594]
MSAQQHAPPSATSASQLLTLVITTSPTPSAPSTDLVSDVLDSFKLHCPILLSCKIVVVLDTYDRVGECNRLKKGQVTAEGAQVVEQYKRNVKALIIDEYHVVGDESVFSPVSSPDAEFGSPHAAENQIALSVSRTEDKRVTFVEPAARLGFGLAVRSALRIVDTPYVWIQQHDWPLVRDIPLCPLLEVMQQAEEEEEVPVKYVCLPAIRMLSYAVSAHVIRFSTLRDLTAKLKREFFPKSQPGVGVPLTPLFFWHDKPHIASTAHYLARVFPTRLAIARGDFIEDSIGQRARTQMKEGNWKKWACWLYYPADGKEVCLRHRHGRKWRGMEAELGEKAQFSQMRMGQGELVS